MKKTPLLFSFPILILTAWASAAPAAQPTSERRSVGPQVVGAVSHILLPASAYVNGQFGAVFKTRIAIYNVVGRSYPIRAGFSTQNGEIATNTFTIHAYETLTFDNFIGDVFGIKGGGAIDLDSGNSSNRFVTAAQVYVDTSSGRYSTAVQSADEAGTIVAGRPGYVVGISVDQFDRTNFGCASDSNRSQTIRGDIYDRNGGFVSTLSFGLVPFGWNQVGVGSAVTNGMILVTTDQRAICYGVTVDNLSNDGTFVLAVPD